jgi:NADPH:quinone reductase-like Zn-dependent oxidoreductase
MLQGTTALYLSQNTYRLQEHEAVLIRTAAEGVGMLLCRWRSCAVLT